MTRLCHNSATLNPEVDHGGALQQLHTQAECDGFVSEQPKLKLLQTLLSFHPTMLLTVSQIIERWSTFKKKNIAHIIYEELF